MNHFCDEARRIEFSGPSRSPFDQAFPCSAAGVRLRLSLSTGQPIRADEAGPSFSVCGESQSSHLRLVGQVFEFGRRSRLRIGFRYSGVKSHISGRPKIQKTAIESNDESFEWKSAYDRFFRNSLEQKVDEDSWMPQFACLRFFDGTIVLICFRTELLLVDQDAKAAPTRMALRLGWTESRVRG